MFNKKIFRGIFLFLGLVFILSFVKTGYSQEIVLNSCDNQIWQDNTIYILNFSEVSVDYLNDYCFLITNKKLTNITMYSLKNITITAPNLRYFIKFDITGGYPSGFEQSLIKNINITINNGGYFYFIYMLDGDISQSITINFYLRRNIFDKIFIINNYNYTNFNFVQLSQGYTKSGANIYIERNNYKNLFIYSKKNYLLFYYNRNFATQSGYLSFRDNIFENILYITDDNTPNYIVSITGSAFSYAGFYVRILNNTFKSNVFLSEMIKPIYVKLRYASIIKEPVIFEDTIFKGYSLLTNSSILVIDEYQTIYLTNKKINLFNHSFIGSYKLSSDYITTNENIIVVNDKNFTLNDIILFNNDNNKIKFVNDINILELQSINLLKTNSIDCDLLYNNYCFFNDLNYNGLFLSSNNNRGLITIDSDTYINHIFFEKNNQQTNAHIISTIDNKPINNFKFINSWLSKQDSRNKNGDEHMIRLYVNNLLFKNNTFNTGGASGTSYELFDIKADNPNSNIITQNEFRSALSDYHNGVIFSGNDDVVFYNNYIDAYYTLTDVQDSNLIINPLVSYYDETTNKIYYFRLGNYYSDYSSSCEDLNNDGICDNPYNIGSVIDNYPLSEYPFDYANHILTAESSVFLNDFNITIYVPESNNLVYDLTSTEDNLQFAFAHNSEILDLTCSYIINGNPVYLITNVNSSIQSVYISGFTEGHYSFYVECYNDYIYKRSAIYDFFVNYPGGVIPPENYTNSNSGSSGSGSDSGISIIGFSEEDILGNIDLITDDPIETTDNINSLINSFSNIGGYLIILGIVSLFVVAVMFIFTILKLMLGGMIK